jgi:hypothetical protein
MGRFEVVIQSLVRDDARRLAKLIIAFVVYEQNTSSLTGGIGSARETDVRRPAVFFLSSLTANFGVRAFEPSFDGPERQLCTSGRVALGIRWARGHNS